MLRAGANGRSPPFILLSLTRLPILIEATVGNISTRQTPGRALHGHVILSSNDTLLKEPQGSSVHISPLSRRITRLITAIYVLRKVESSDSLRLI